MGADGELVISMEKKSGNEEKNGKDTYLRREFSYSQFRQSLLLPDNVKTDDICAKVENGVLTIDIPKKKESEESARGFLIHGKSLFCCMQKPTAHSTDAIPDTPAHRKTGIGGSVRRTGLPTERRSRRYMPPSGMPYSCLISSMTKVLITEPRLSMVPKTLSVNS